MRNLVRLLLALIATLPAQAGWFSTPSDPLAGSEWRLVEVEGQPATGEAFLQFQSGGQMAGDTGVNKLSGTYRAKESNFQIGPLVTTKRAGSPEAMNQELLFLQGLEHSTSFRRQTTTLELREGERIRLLLRQRDAD